MKPRESGFAGTVQSRSGLSSFRHYTELREWREPQCRFQMIRRQVRVAHGHRDRRVSQDPLQAENVTTGHHVMTGKGVPQDVGHLARCIEAATLVCTPKGRPAGHE